MKNRTLMPILLTALILVVFPGAAMGGEVTVINPGEIKADTLWKGECILTGLVGVASGATLRIEKGAIIRARGTEAGIEVFGDLLAEGEAGHPIVFEPESSKEGSSWAGVTVKVMDHTIRFTFCRFRGAERALTLVTGSAVIMDCSYESNGRAVEASLDSRLAAVRCTFRGNKVGIVGQLRSIITVTDSTFEANEESGATLLTSAGGRLMRDTFRGGIGIIVKQGNNVFIGDSTFDRCTLGVVLDQVKEDVRLSGNILDGGTMGIRCLNFATPWIACCRFLSLETGILVERFSNPMITHSLYRKNKLAISVTQKSNFPIRDNVFEGNERAIFLDLSSYPAIHRNNFTGNGRDIVLGNMSSDWEHRIGSKRFTRENAEKSRSRNIDALNQDREYPGVVEAGDNWWGEATTREMEAAGPEANITSIEDYYDTPTISYPPEYGEGSFIFDRVRYDLWAKDPIPGAGPLPAGCGDFNSGAGGANP